MIGLAYVELLLRAVNMFELLPAILESGSLHQLVSYPGWNRRSLFIWMAFLKYY